VHASLNDVIEYGSYTTEPCRGACADRAREDGEDAFDTTAASRPRIAAYYCGCGRT
jgi:hypothetical protein